MEISLGKREQITNSHWIQERLLIISGFVNALDAALVSAVT